LNPPNRENAYSKRTWQPKGACSAALIGLLEDIEFGQKIGLGIPGFARL
jgi:hypothetical protein